jgi:hypothetical protein
MACPFYPRENSISEREIPLVGFHLVNKDAGIERDPAVTPEK